MADSATESAERTEPATARKRDETRNKGMVSKSMEVNSAAIVFFGLLLIHWTSAGIIAQIMSISRSIFMNAGRVEVTYSAVQESLLGGIGVLVVVLGPILIGFLAIGLMASTAQVGFHIATEALEIKWGKLNPFKSIKSMFFSQKAIVELMKNVIKVVLVGWVAYSAISSVVEESVSLMDGDVEGIVTFLGRSTFAAGMKIGLTFLVIAAFDYIYQRYQFEKDLRMTKEEVKEETKMQDGNPIIKSRIRGIQRQIAYKRMMFDVPKADVVVTNPTHLAIAIKYESKKMNAPRVVAKGADLIAQRIKEIALEHNVPIVEDKMLARTLYKAVDIGDEVPAKLFQAVAQLLAYIYRMKKSRPGFETN